MFVDVVLERAPARCGSNRVLEVVVTENDRHDVRAQRATRDRSEKPDDLVVLVDDNRFATNILLHTIAFSSSFAPQKRVKIGRKP